MFLVLLLFDTVNKHSIIDYWNFVWGIGISHNLLILWIASGDMLFKVSLQLILIWVGVRVA